jgi:ribosomal protein L24
LGKYIQLVESILTENTKFRVGDEVVMLRGEFVGKSAEVVGIENVGESDERYAVKYNGEIYKFEPKGLKVVDDEYKQGVTEENTKKMLSVG